MIPAQEGLLKETGAHPRTNIKEAGGRYARRLLFCWGKGEWVFVAKGFFARTCMYVGGDFWGRHPPLKKGNKVRILI